MMKSKVFISVLMALFVSLLTGVAAQMGVGLPALPTAGVVMGVSLVPTNFTGGISLVGVYKEVWTGEVLKALSAAEKGTFLEGIPDSNKYVSAVGDEAQAINSTYFGVMPDVLINNTTYPIPLQELNGENILIQLDKFQTKVTPVTDDELYALSYDKMALVKDSHSQAIVIAKIKKAIHALAPGSNTAKMPVLLCTGEDDGTGRRRLTFADIIRLKNEFDKLEIGDDRRLVLSTEHENDLLLADQKFRDQYYNMASGKPYSSYSFEFYSYIANPYFNPSTKTKLAWGATPTATDHRASVAFAVSRQGKASGWMKMYYSDSKTDPQNQRNLIAFRHHYIVMPKREEARGAIVSDNV